MSTYRAERVRGFAIVAGQGFELERREGGGVPVVACYHPDFQERFGVVIDRTVEAVAWHRETYGFFPLDQVGIIQGHPRYSGGYPLPNMFAVHLGNLDDNHLSFITAQELGHYCWGFTVLASKETAGPNDLDWLTLGMGIWGDRLYLAERKGIPFDEQFRRDRRQGSWLVDYLELLTAGYDQRMLLAPAEQFEYEGRPLHRDDFVSLLERNGSPDARPFLEVWYRDNAAVELDRVEPDPFGGWRVLVRRTGSAPYPVTVAVEAASGERRHVLPERVGLSAVWRGLEEGLGASDGIRR